MPKSLKTEFLGVTITSPLVLPAGVMGMAFSGFNISLENGAGIVTSKSLTLKPRTGHKGPVVAEFEGGFLNCKGLCNPGIVDGIAEIDEFKKRSDIPVIASVFATKIQDFIELTKHINKSQAEFLELNLSCPNVFDEFGIPLAASQEEVHNIVKAVKQISKLTKIPATTVYNRIKNLENEKIIKSYGINLDFDKLGYDIKVIIQVRISKGKLFEVEKAVSKSENVYAVYDLTGDFDALIVARFKSRQSLDNFLKKLQSYDFVQRTHTSFVLNTIKE